MNIDKERIAKEVSSFLDALCKLDSEVLESRWGMSAALVDEAKEALERYSDDGSARHFEGPALSPSDIHVSGADQNDRAPLRLFELDQGDAVSVECDLWFRGKRSDLTALMDVYEREGGLYEIDFRMLEVQ